MSLTLKIAVLLSTCRTVEASGAFEELRRRAGAELEADPTIVEAAPREAWDLWTLASRAWTSIPRATDAELDGGARAFFALKRSPAFSRSAALRSWSKEFLSYPDLRAANERYYRDRHPWRFCRAVAASPNFRRMILERGYHPDIRGFAADLAASVGLGASR